MIGMAKSNSGVVLGALVVAVAMAAGTGAVGSSAGSSSGSGADVPVAAGTGTRGDRMVARLDRVADRVEPLASDAGSDCAAPATGQVRDYFQEHPCTELTRARYRVQDGSATVDVAVAWVDMPDADQALRYENIIDTEGTGTVRPLTRDGTGTDTSFDGVAYDSVREGGTVLIAQAAPVDGGNGAGDLAERAVRAATAV